MKTRLLVQLTGFAALALAGCASDPLAISDETIRETRSAAEETKARQIHEEYWRAQRDAEEAREDARRRAQERARGSRQSSTVD